MKMKKYIYTNYRQFFFHKGAVKSSHQTPLRTPVMYWKPTIGSGGAQLNDYQYIKCKWLFELLTGRAPILHKDYGFILLGTASGTALPQRGGPAPSLLPFYWPHELLGNRYRLFNTVFLSGRGGPSKSSNRTLRTKPRFV